MQSPISSAANSGVSTMPPEKLKPSSTGTLPGTGKKMPRLVRNTPGSGCSASRGAGRTSAITVYQKKSWTSSGELRMNST